MRSVTIHLIIIFSFLMLAGCKSNKEETNPKDNAEITENMNNKINASASDEAGIRKALDSYIEAAVKGDSNIAKKVFSDLATISYSENDSMVNVPIQVLYDYYDRTGPHHAEYEITALETAGNIGIVRIDSKFGDVSFDDMFSLVKDGDEWKIVSKAYNVK